LLLERALAILDQHCSMPGQRAWVQFTLARALAATHGDATRAATLAHQARDELAQLPSNGWRLEHVEAWMKENHIP
jgi:hypothetical protein